MDNTKGDPLIVVRFIWKYTAYVQMYYVFLIMRFVSI